MSDPPDANGTASTSRRAASPLSGSPLPLEFANRRPGLDSGCGAGHGYGMEDRGIFNGRGFWALALLWLPAGVVAQALVRFAPGLVEAPGAGLSVGLSLKSLPSAARCRVAGLVDPLPGRLTIVVDMGSLPDSMAGAVGRGSEGNHHAES